MIYLDSCGFETLAQTGRSSILTKNKSNLIPGEMQVCRRWKMRLEWGIMYEILVYSRKGE